jgi:hypothetical protein
MSYDNIVAECLNVSASVDKVLIRLVQHQLHQLLKSIGLLLHLLLELLELPHVLLELLLLWRLSLHLLHESIASSKKLCEEREIRLWAELRRINVCHGFS